MNMQKKQIIQIGIIIVAFGGAGLVLYNGLFKNNSSGPELTMSLPGIMSTSTPGSGMAGQAVQNGQEILPNGSKLDFSIFSDPNEPKFQFNQIVYPQLNEKQEVGINENNLISSSGPLGQ